ncbi:MAG: glycosyl hydrolase family 18 protein [Lentimonas sp.]
MKHFLLISVFMATIGHCFMSSIYGQAPSDTRRVMTWVPPYAIDACLERLDESYSEIGMKHGLTHLGLQFWRTTIQGDIALVNRFDAIDDSTISAFRQWGDANDVSIMLCVYNGSAEGWNWDLAKVAFDAHREEFVNALVDETLRLNLDGVDIDLEGNGPLNDSKDVFVRFIEELSVRLHAEGKELTVDSFAYKWHAPNQSWWPALLPHVDALHVMGYSETGANAEGWRAYEFIKAAAGPHASKLLIGMPSHQSEWQNSTAQEHLQWIVDDGIMGLAIWDARLKNPRWRTSPIWKTIVGFKAGNESENLAR